jgi:hypothetical protein
MDAIQLAIDALQGAGIGLDSTNVFGGALPEHFDPTSNAALVIHVRGGQAHAEIPIVKSSVVITCWAGINQFKLARATYSKVFSALNGINNQDFGVDGCIIYSVEEMTGQDVVDPDTGWATVICAFEMLTRESSASNNPTIVSGIPRAGRHTPLEVPDGIRRTFTFPSLPFDQTQYLIDVNGMITTSGFVQQGETIIFDDALSIGTDIFGYY